ncbi:alpha/beta hydrolase fold domain-containing protein [Amycolatopsis sp. WQ 127309]|uniref:alpha/beta hydrolase fold domain-containing protein n=1 Tax=Amycolatopsis sp. WQ 127309 TaxID=2932773 RepID=UPI001FF67CDC|nr:alpha/beta hydrolase fold domain-containing protein [Amycolatopsis sp. WQ 127309]UOZ05304.1 alpha/beta hydrolase fold domain-containing protein [Amycolatopsis sp. WQ 127309]
MTVYREVLGFRPLELDLHLPAGPGPHPAIVYLHGGGWRRGSRRTTIPASLCPTLAERGFAVAAADYRLSGEARFPAQLEDVRAAITWLRSEVDCAATFLWGESAGAHLALLAALDGGDVDGVVAWYPPTDLLGLADGFPGAVDDSREAELLGVAPSADPDRARAASPLTFAHRNAPPILLMHGDADDLVPPAQSERLASALRAVGAPVELDLVPGARHMWTDARDVGAIVDRSVQFLRALG